MPIRRVFTQARTTTDEISHLTRHRAKSPQLYTNTEGFLILRTKTISKCHEEHDIYQKLEVRAYRDSESIGKLTGPGGPFVRTEVLWRQVWRIARYQVSVMPDTLPIIKILKIWVGFFVELSGSCKAPIAREPSPCESITIL
jgi:hypothetical protein